MKELSYILAENLQQAFLANATNVAIDESDRQFTYTDLHQMSVSISHHIIDAANNDSAVAILGKKSFYTYAGICGAIFASHAYMPMNLKFPTARNLSMLRTSDAEVIVADKDSIGMLDKILKGSERSYTVICEMIDDSFRAKHSGHIFVMAGPKEDLPLPVLNSDEDDTAYLLFTSGTTGSPKGVPVSNGNVMSYIRFMMNKWEFREKDRFSQTFDLTFDLSVHDMMLCWLSGACLCIPEEDSAFKMVSYIRDQKISVWFSVPSVAMLMNKMRLLKAGAYDTIRLSFFCGEALPVQIAEKWQESTNPNSLTNLYGPSEATIAISFYQWNLENQKSLNDVVSIGKMFEGQDFCMMDPDQKLTDSKGELCLGGSQIISGYFQDPDLTSKYFIEFNEYPGKIWYRTGDLVSMDESGDLFYLGRLDSEVKISGFRVNLLEIDSVIRQVKGTEQVASIFDDRSPSKIVCFISGESTITETEIMSRCQDHLPWYMIPEVIIFVEEMPLNDNGKIDRNTLKRSLDGKG